MHGWRSESKVWHKIINSLQNPSLRVLALDLPGFGQSPAPKHEFYIKDYTNIVAEFIKKLELKDVIVVGHSFGGRIGISLAAIYPDLVKKLILVDGAGFVTSSFRKTSLNLIAKIIRPLFYPVFMKGLRAKIYNAIGAGDYVATPKLKQTFINIVGEDLTEEMKSVSCPTLIIFGSQDKDTPVKYGQKMNMLIRNSQLEIVEGAGHFSFLDKPKEFLETLTNFIK